MVYLTHVIAKCWLLLYEPAGTRAVQRGRGRRREEKGGGEDEWAARGYWLARDAGTLCALPTDIYANKGIPLNSLPPHPHRTRVATVLCCLLVLSPCFFFCLHPATVGIAELAAFCTFSSLVCGCDEPVEQHTEPNYRNWQPLGARMCHAPSATVQPTHTHTHTLVTSHIF